jgi:hypothetical protein
MVEYAAKKKIPQGNIAESKWILMMQQRNNMLGLFLLSATALIWGGSFVAQKLGMDHIGPFSFTFSAISSPERSFCRLRRFAPSQKAKGFRGRAPMSLEALPADSDSGAA